MLIYHLIFHLSSSNWPSPDGLSKLVLIPITPVIAKPSSTLERRDSVKRAGKAMREEDDESWLRREKINNRRQKAW